MGLQSDPIDPTKTHLLLMFLVWGKKNVIGNGVIIHCYFKTFLDFQEVVDVLFNSADLLLESPYWLVNSVFLWSTLL